MGAAFAVDRAEHKKCVHRGWAAELVEQIEATGHYRFRQLGKVRRRQHLLRHHKIAAHHQHRTGRTAQQPVGRRAEEGLQARRGFAGTHHDEIGVDLISNFE